MEYLNKIEIQGYIGNINFTTIQGTTMARFSVMTETAYNTKDGAAVVDTTWFHCSAFEGEDIKNISKLKKGDAVHLTGRVRMQKFVGTDGMERSIWEILCKTLKIVTP